MEFQPNKLPGFLNGTIEGDPNVKVSNFLNRRREARYIDLFYES